jgi:acyl-coenzyme A synthetase/AMP-(fatty) acid ligase
VPSLSARWLDAAERTGSRSVDSLRYTLFAGEPLHGRQVHRWRAIAPGTTVVNLYGPSETTLATCHYTVPADCDAGLQPVGLPLPDGTVDLVPVDQSGRSDTCRVVITTPHGSLGYLPGACSPDDLRRLRREHGVTRFETQDRGHHDVAGNLVIEGRLDSLVKRRGTFVDVMRIEAAAADLPDVVAACCVQSPATSEIVLVVVPADQSADSAAAVAGLRRKLRAPLGADLPDHVVALPTMPTLPSGKVDRLGVRALIGPEKVCDERKAS